MRASQTQDKFIVRLPDGMREQISEAAAANNRSMTAEIVARLSKSFEDNGTGRSNATHERVEQEIDDVRTQLRVETMERIALDAKITHLELRLLALESTIS